MAIGVPRDWIELRQSELLDQTGPPVVSVTGAHRVALISAACGAGVAAAVAVFMTLGIVPAAGFEFLGTSPLLAGLRGLVGGGAAGALFGYILGLGMWESDGEPEARVAVDDLVVSVLAANRWDELREVLEGGGGRLL